MVKATVQDLLKKINYIEADLEIQKQILFSIPTDQVADIEHTIGEIAAKTKEIEGLRNQIRELDPQEYQRIVTFEKAIASFSELGKEKTFTGIVSRQVGEDCNLSLKDGSSLPCLIKGCDEDGGWTVITMEGEVRSFDRAEVNEQPIVQDLTPMH